MDLYFMLNPQVSIQTGHLVYKDSLWTQTWTSLGVVQLHNRIMKIKDEAINVKMAYETACLTMSDMGKQKLSA